MKKLALFIILALCLFAPKSKAFVTRYWYVATTGNDSNDGAIGSPYLTVLKAVTMAQCGDTVDIRGGTHRGFSVVAGIQTFCTGWDLPVTVQGHSGESVVLTEPGSTGVVGFNPGSHYTSIKADAWPLYWIFKDFTMDGTGGLAGEASNIQSVEVSHVQFVRVRSTNSQRPPYIAGAYWWFFDCEFDHTVISHGIYITSTDSIIDGGSFHDNAGLGAQFTDSGHNDINNSIARNAKFYNNGSNGLAMSNGANAKAYNNLLWNNVTAGLAIGAAGVCQSCSALNNTSYGNQGYGIIFGNIPEAGGAVTGTTVIENNIAYGDSNTDIFDGNSSNGGSGGTVTVKNNLTGGALTNPGSWTSPSGNVTGDPLFTNPTTLFTLSSAMSPAVGAGLNLSTTTSRDYAGNGRPASPTAWDVGAYVYNGTPSAMLSSVSPNTGSQGETKDVTLTGVASSAVDGTTTSGFGAGITINTTHCTSTTSCVANITISGGATPGTRTVTLTTVVDGALTKPTGFTVVAAPVLSTVSPAQGARGTGDDVTVIGIGTAWDGTYDCDMGAGITVTLTQVVSATAAACSYTIASDAALGLRTVSMIASGHTDAKSNGFLVADTNTLTTGALTLAATFTSIAVKAAYTGNSDADATALVEYKASSSNTWLQAYTPYIDTRQTIDDTANTYKNQARVSIVGLTANTAYDVRITWTDPDGVLGDNPVTGSVTTVTTTPTTGGATTTVTNSSTLNSALAAVVAGETIHLNAATYNAFTLSRSGSAGAYIKIDCDPSAIIAGAGVSQNVLITGSYVIFQNCTLGASDFNGITATGHHVYIQDNTLQSISTLCADGPATTHQGDTGIATGSHDVYVLRNMIIGAAALATPACTESPTYDGPATGIQLYDGLYNFVADGNTVTGGFRDGISSDSSPNLIENADLMNNTVVGYKDDGVESKGGNVNVRMQANHVTMSTTGDGNTCYALNTNPVEAGGFYHSRNLYGPIYIYRNTCRVTVAGSTGQVHYKTGGQAVPSYFFHNSIDSHLSGSQNFDSFNGSNQPLTAYNNINYSRNGVIVAFAATGNVFDYNVGYQSVNTNGWAYRWNNVTDYDTLASFRSGTGQDTHSIRLDPGFTNTSLDTNSSSPGYHAGVAIANFNGANSAWVTNGNAPDIGAYNTNSPCTPHHLTVTAQPSSALIGATLGTITVGVYDSGNVLCPAATNTISLTKHAATCIGMTLNGVQSGQVSSGLFTTLDATLTGGTGSCSLDAAASGLTGATTNSITITQGTGTPGGGGALGRLRTRTR